MELAPPVIEIYSDRLTITSYGGLVQGLSKEEFFAGRSMPRNRELMRVFKDLKFVEQLGSGIHRILDAYDESIFKISDNFLEISFPFEADYIESLKGGVKGGAIGGIKGGQMGGQIGGQMGGQIDTPIDTPISTPISILTDRQKEILNLIIENNKISRSKISALLNINTSAVQKHIDALVKKEVIKRIGGTRGYWEVNFSDE
ncbi:MAG: winged helix-turn-helix transcriptional regulator [Saprospiraceae bacterium]|nr:winged helix-turn-helix transcriptional regulator [Saprospiraceae bacterium]